MKHKKAEQHHLKHHAREETQAANEVSQKWEELKATFDERPKGFDLSFPGEQPRQILIATMMGTM